MEEKNNTNYILLTCAFVVLLIPFLGIAGIKNIMAPAIYQAWQVASAFALFLILIMYSPENKDRLVCGAVWCISITDSF